MISRLNSSLIHTSPVRPGEGASVYIDTNGNGVQDQFFMSGEPIFADTGHYRALKSQPGLHTNVEVLVLNQDGVQQRRGLDALAQTLTGKPSAKGYIEVDEKGEMAFQATDPEAWLSPYTSATPFFNPYYVPLPTNLTSSL